MDGRITFKALTHYYSFQVDILPALLHAVYEAYKVQRIRQRESSPQT